MLEIFHDHNFVEIKYQKIQVLQRVLLSLTIVSFLAAICSCIISPHIPVDDTKVVASIAEPGSSEAYSIEDVDNEKVDTGHTTSELHESIYSFCKSCIALLGLSNVVMSGLIVSNSKYKYGYILEPIITKYYIYKHCHIFIYFFIVLVDYFLISMELFFPVVFTTIGIFLFFSNFLLIYYSTCLSDSNLKKFIIKDISSKIDKLNSILNKNSSYNIQELYKDLKYHGSGIMTYVTEKTNNKQGFDKEIAYNCINEILKLENSTEPQIVTHTFIKKSLYDFRVTDVSIILYELLSILLDDCANDHSVSKSKMLNCIPELLEKTIGYKTSKLRCYRNENLNMAVALWLIFNVDYSFAEKILSNITFDCKSTYDCDNCMKILLYYLYANVCFYLTDFDVDGKRYKSVQNWVNNNAIFIKKVLKTIVQNSDSENYINDCLHMFKVRQLSLCSSEKKFLFSTSIPTLERRINALLIYKETLNCLSPLDEILVHFNIKIEV